MPRENFGEMLGDDRSSDPVYEVVRAAKAVTSRNYRDDQPSEFAELQSAAEAVPDDSKTRAVFRLVMSVMREEVPVQSLFALARVLGKMSIAYGTAAIRDMMRAEGFTTEDLIDYGLMERVPAENGNTRLKPFIGNERIKAAVVKLDAEGRYDGARVLRSHLNRASEARGAATARRERREADEGDNAVAASETTPPVAVGGTNADGTEGGDESPQNANGEAPNEGEEAPVSAAKGVGS